MPQEFNVLRCYSCETFQVHIVKKSNKWCCKMCGEKQSVKKVYGQGTGKDCRLLVQSLNEKRMINDLNESENIISDFDNCDIQDAENSSSTATEFEPPKTSKWSEYLTEENELSESECDTNSQYTFERPNKRKFVGKKGLNSTSTEKKKKVNYECEDDIENFPTEYNSVESNINDLQTKQQISKMASKWSSFVTSQEDSASFEEIENNSVGYNIDSENEIKQQISKKASKWSSFVASQEDSASLEEIENNSVGYNIDSENEIKQQISKKVSKWNCFATSQENSANCEKIYQNSSENNINSGNEIKQKISQTESKWSYFVTSQDNSANSENTSVLKSIFDSTDMDSLDDILNFELL